jgi:DNA primase large subunit
MTAPRDPHEIDLSLAFPSLPEDWREEMRDFLDGYCEIALQVFERLEQERLRSIDRSRQTS